MDQPPVPGVITPSLEGPPLRVAVAAMAGHVIVAFEPTISWIALTPEEAQELAAHLANSAGQLSKRR